MSGQDASLGGDFEKLRGAVRRKLFEPVTMAEQGNAHGAPFRAHLLDISCSGALAHADTPPLPDARLRIDVMGFSLAARVMWVNAKRFGIRFDALLSDDQLDRLLDATDIVVQPAGTRAEMRPVRRA